MKPPKSLLAQWPCSGHSPCRETRGRGPDGSELNGGKVDPGAREGRSGAGPKPGAGPALEPR